MLRTILTNKRDPYGHPYGSLGKANIDSGSYNLGYILISNSGVLCLVVEPNTTRFCYNILHPKGGYDPTLFGTIVHILIEKSHLPRDGNHCDRLPKHSGSIVIVLGLCPEL